MNKFFSTIYLYLSLVLKKKKIFMKIKFITNFVFNLIIFKYIVYGNFFLLTYLKF
jgi:hypothetical protein